MSGIPNPGAVISEKTCTKCLDTLPVSQFNRRPDRGLGASGYDTLCSPCRSEHRKQHRLANSDRIKAYDRARYVRDPNRRKYRCRDTEAMYTRKLLRTYNLTREEYEALKARSGGKCAICERVAKKMVVDHDHDTGKVRAFLCANCNSGIGFLDDNIDLVRAAARYLETHSEVT